MDKEEHTIVTLVGQLDNTNYRDVVKDAAKVMQKVESLRANQFTQKILHHRRGEYLALSAGVSFEGGQKVRT